MSTLSVTICSTVLAAAESIYSNYALIIIADGLIVNRHAALMTLLSKANPEDANPEGHYPGLSVNC